MFNVKTGFLTESKMTKSSRVNVSEQYWGKIFFGVVIVKRVSLQRAKTCNYAF